MTRVLPYNLSPRSKVHLRVSLSEPWYGPALCGLDPKRGWMRAQPGDVRLREMCGKCVRSSQDGAA
jgi:hypothetical protein